MNTQSIFSMMVAATCLPFLYFLSLPSINIRVLLPIYLFCANNIMLFQTKSNYSNAHTYVSIYFIKYIHSRTYVRTYCTYVHTSICILYIYSFIYCIVQKRIQNHTIIQRSSVQVYKYVHTLC